MQNENYNKWLEHKVMLDSMLKNGLITQYLYEVMSVYIRKKLGLPVVEIR